MHVKVFHPFHLATRKFPQRLEFSVSPQSSRIRPPFMIRAATTLSVHYSVLMYSVSSDCHIIIDLYNLQRRYFGVGFCHFFLWFALIDRCTEGTLLRSLHKMHL